MNSTLNDQSKARLLSVASAEAGAWLNVLPVPSLGTKLDDESLRIALGLHLGAVIGNVASVMATIPPSSDWTEFISLPPL